MTSTTALPLHHSLTARTILEEQRWSTKLKTYVAKQGVMAQQASIDETRSEDQLVAMLRSIDERDAAAGQLDSAALGRCLGWTAARTAASLAVAKRRLLIWGIRVGGSPAPCFEDIELTVQGRRLLRSAAG
jgi:hypothetical protein